MRFTYVATFITILLYAMVTWGTTGDTTVVGPTFSFGNISTSNNKVRATRPSDRVIFAGSNGATVEASGKTVTFFSPIVGGVVGFKQYSSGVKARFNSTFITQTANPNLPNSQAMGALSTGIVKNTTTTGVQSIAIASDFPTLNQDTSGTAANLSGTPALPNGTTATTQAAGDNSTKLATDAYVDTGLAAKVPYTGATAALDMGAYGATAASFTTGGNLAFTGTGNRITGDFSNATLTNRTAFQSSTTNGATAVATLPNGTSTTSRFVSYNAADPTNAAFTTIAATSTVSSLTAGTSGSGTGLPLTFSTTTTGVTAAERMRILTGTAGNILMGATTETAGAEKLQVTGAISATGAVLVGGGANTVYYCDAGASVGNMCRGNGCSCVGGAWIATSLKID